MAKKQKLIPMPKVTTDENPLAVRIIAFFVAPIIRMFFKVEVTGMEKLPKKVLTFLPQITPPMLMVWQLPISFISSSSADLTFLPKRRYSTFLWLVKHCLRVARFQYLEKAVSETMTPSRLQTLTCKQVTSFASTQKELLRENLTFGRCAVRLELFA